MKNILVIQSRATPEAALAEQERYKRAAGDAAALSFVSALDVEQKWETPAQLIKGYDAVIIGGSSDFFWHDETGEGKSGRTGAHNVLDRMRALIEHLIETDTPTLGVCFGHQLIAEARGGNVTHDHAQKKIGTFEVQLTAEGRRDRLFSQMPEKFLAQYAHLNSVTTLPRGATLLATGASCRFSALRYGTRVYTLQFHPELIAQDLLSAPEAAAPYLAPGVKVEDVVTESPDASRILPLFIQCLESPEPRARA